MLGHSNIIKLRDVIRPSNIANFRDVYLVFEYLPTDLHQVLLSPTYLTGEHIKWLMLDMLKALKYIHSAQIIHRDIKPANGNKIPPCVDSHFVTLLWLQFC
jgi:mitogen-activated protein kinase 1/3